MKTRQLLLIFTLLLPIGTWAEVYTDPATNIMYSYNVSNGTASVKGGSKSVGGNPDATGDITILSSFIVDGITYPVTAIGQFAFNGCKGLTSVTIPNSVTTIYRGVFYNCSGLTSVTIPSSVTSIGTEVFYGCRSLTTLTLPSNLTSIPGELFYGCSGLTSITIPSGVTKIGEAAFRGCSGLTSVHISDIAAWCKIDFNDQASNPLCYARHLYLGEDEITELIIPSNVTTISNYAFYGCEGIASVTIPSNVTSIGDYTFSGCSGLASFTIPSSVTTIGSGAFSNCSSLTSITIPSNVTSIGNSVFYGCSSLSSVSIQSDLTSIGNSFFYNCSSLSSVTIPSSVTSIGSEAFYGCSGLTSITIPSGVTSIGSEAFEGCSGLTSIIVDESNTFYDSRGNCNAIIKTSNNELIAGFKNTVIPNSVVSIGDHAFRNCSGLTSLTIPDGVATIGRYALAGCGLTSITLPNSVTYIGNYAFYNCNSLTSITLSNSVTYIGDYAFGFCGLTSITIPSAVTSIKGNAFFSCTRLTSITMMGNPTIGSNAFPSNKTITQSLTPNSVGYDKWLTYYNDYANFQADANTKVYKGSVEDGNVMLTAVNDKIVKAGEAVLLKSTSATITMSSTKTASADDYEDNELRGLNARTATSSILTGDLSGGIIYVLGNQNSHFGFHEYTGEYMAANKAFLALPSSSSGSRRLSIVFRNGETGVDMPISETEGASAYDWYTLDGRKLVAEPTVPGVYVNQGKKVIVK